jgi:tungstate transport system substrate-binding protein
MPALVSCGEQPQPQRVLLGTTTSVHDSGLTDELARAFAAAHPAHRLVVLAVGSGEALRLAERGDVDVVISHSPDDEVAFMAAGYGEARLPVMHNMFVLLGPPDDPAAAAQAPLLEALRRIRDRGLPFVSRGDRSGTHRAEQALWARAGVVPDWAGYVEGGAGMADVLRLAAARRAYTLSDAATWATLRQGLRLRVVQDGDPLLKNEYSVIVSRAAGNVEGARAFADWLRGPEARQLIGDFRGSTGAEPLFIPEAGSPAPESTP